MGLNEALADAFARYGDAPALLSQDGQILSFEKLGYTVSVLATRLRDEGVGPGQCVALLTDNRTLRNALMLAMFRVGADVALVNATGPLVRRGQTIDAAVRFADQNAEGVDRSIVFSQDWLSGKADPSMTFAAPGIIIAGTSGSTGEPRFVQFPPKAYFDLIPALHDGSGPSLGNVLVTVPETGLMSIYTLFRALLAGHGHCGMSPTGTESLFEAERFGVREFMATPLALNELVMAADAGAPKPKLARICVFGSVSERSLLQRAERVFGCPIGIVNGSTETGQTSFGIVDTATYVTGWSGRPVSICETRIGEGEPQGASGRLFVRTSVGSIAGGYIGGPPALDAEGWFDTGDIARIESDGVLMIEGRADNLINLGGGKYAAEKIETFAAEITGVSMSAAVRLQDAEGAVPALGVAVVASDGFDAERLREHLAKKLRTSAHIRVITAPNLPSLPTGKIDRRAVVAFFG